MIYMAHMIYIIYMMNMIYMTACTCTISTLHFDLPDRFGRSVRNGYIHLNGVSV